jgi:hypothetical protein
MKLTMDRSLCNHVLSKCESCFARLMVNPLGEDRHCITEYVPDDDETIYLTLKYDGNVQQLTLSPADRELVATLGWSRFVDVLPRFYRE